MVPSKQSEQSIAIGRFGFPNILSLLADPAVLLRRFAHLVPLVVVELSLENFLPVDHHIVGGSHCDDHSTPRDLSDLDDNILANQNPFSYQSTQCKHGFLPGLA
jgi:hypothetical protein